MAALETTPQTNNWKTWHQKWLTYFSYEVKSQVENNLPQICFFLSFLFTIKATRDTISQAQFELSSTTLCSPDSSTSSSVTPLGVLGLRTPFDSPTIASEVSGENLNWSATPRVFAMCITMVSTALELGRTSSGNAGQHRGRYSGFPWYFEWSANSPLQKMNLAPKEQAI